MLNRNILVNFWLISGLIMLFLLSSSCSSWLPEAHKLDVQQGNLIKKSALEKVKIGMTKEKVKAVLGNPSIKDPFHEKRWDYIYKFETAKNTIEKSRVTLFFSDNLLIKISDEDFREY